MNSLIQSRDVLQKSILLSCFFSAPLAALASETSRIEEILSRKTFDQRGQVLVSEVQARIQECAIHLILEKPLGCEKGASFYSATDVIDVRALATDPNDVKLTDFAGTRFESMKGSAEYPYRFLYNRLLRRANDSEQQISDEEFENHPTDVDTRLRILSRRFSNEIDARGYSMSFTTTQFCSGIEVKGPLRSEYFNFYLEPDEMKEFVGLIEGLAKSCVVAPSG